MDGMLYVVFFLPWLLSFCVAISMIGVSVAFWAGFGSEVESAILDVSPEYIASVLKGSNLMYAIAHPPFRNSYFYQVLINLITVVSVLTTYSLGTLVYRNKGWQFIQPGKGGVRFVILQIGTWVSFGFSMILPWIAIQPLGIMQAFGLDISRANKNEYGAFLVSGAAVGIVSEIFAFLSLVTFDPDSTLPIPKKTPKRKLSAPKVIIRELEIGSLNVGMVFGKNKVWWWMFLAMQISSVLYSYCLLVLTEKQLRNNVIQAILLMVSNLMMVTAIGVTNSIGGKWRHGERQFLLLMPFKGGFMFSMLQGIGWFLFGCSLTLSGMFMSSLFSSEKMEAKNPQNTLIFAGAFGLFSEFMVALSLFFFDPEKVRSKKGYTNTETKIERKDTTQEGLKEIERIIGKRKSPNAVDETEYLIEWKNSRGKTTWVTAKNLNEIKDGKHFVVNYNQYYKTTEQHASRDIILQPPKVRRSLRHRSKHQSRVRSKSRSAEMRRQVVADRITRREDWEEFEDEYGNVYYYNEKTNESSQECPY